MLNILKELEAAHHYKVHGWPTVDQKCRLRRESESVIQKYEKKLNNMLKAVPMNADKAMCCAQLANKVNLPEGTAKKHISVLFKRGDIERVKRSDSRMPSARPTYFYFKRLKCK